MNLEQMGWEPDYKSLAFAQNLISSFSSKKVALNIEHARIDWTPFTLSTALVCWQQHNKFRRTFLTFYHFLFELGNEKMCRRQNAKSAPQVELEPSDSHYQCVYDHYASAKTKQNIFRFVLTTQNNMTRWWYHSTKRVRSYVRLPLTKT